MPSATCGGRRPSIGRETSPSCGNRPIPTSGGSIRRWWRRSSSSVPTPRPSPPASCSRRTSTASGDAASNYGSAGAGIAHEITHSFDELGNIYDDQGRLRRWWTAEDLAGYRAATAKLAAQLDGYCPLPDLCVNGQQVLTESVADLAGLQVAHDAYVISLKGKADVVIGGLTGEQRFFLAFAQRWRRAQTEAALRRQLATDNHLPAQYRSDAVRNVDAWYKAYEIAPGDKLSLTPDARVSIW